MEEINTNIKNIVDEVKSFKEDNVKKIEALEQKNADMEKKYNEALQEINDLKKENLENARQISDFYKVSIKNDQGNDEIQKKYLSNLDQVLRDFASGKAEIKSEYLENAEKCAKMLAKSMNLANEDMEKKYVKSAMQDVTSTQFPVLDLNIKAQAQSTYVGSDGGFGITPAKKLPDYTANKTKKCLYDLVEKVSTSTNQAEVLASDASNEGFWEDEFGSDKTSNVSQGKIIIPTSIVKGSVPLTRTLVEDYNGNIYTYLYPLLDESLTNAVERALFTGNATQGKPKGISQYDELSEAELKKESPYVVGKFKTMVANDAEELISAIVKANITMSTNNNVVVMNPMTLAEILDVKDSQGRPLVQPNMLLEGAVYMINGMNVYTSIYCPKFTDTGSKAVYVGNFSKAYTFVQRTGRTIEFNPYANNNEIIHYMLRQRCGGAAKGFDSLTIIKKA